MEHYVGLDVSLKTTAVCVVDAAGAVLAEGSVASDPDAIARFVEKKAPAAIRVGLESGPTATWLWTELNARGLPVICIDARHAKAVLKMQINKSDRKDAMGIAKIMQCGWFRQVQVKSLDSHAIKALLVSRALLVKIKRDIENQLRGLLKNLGLVIGRAKMTSFLVRVQELLADRPALAAAVDPLLKARATIERQIADLDGKVRRLARGNAQARRFMTARHRPGHRALLSGDDRRSSTLQQIAHCRGVSRIDHPAPRLWRDRPDRAHIKVWGHIVAKLSLRGRQCPADPCREILDTQGLGHADRQTQRHPQGEGRRCAKARRDSPSHVDRWRRVQMVIKGGY